MYYSICLNVTYNLIHRIQTLSKNFETYLVIGIVQDDSNTSKGENIAVNIPGSVLTKYVMWFWPQFPGQILSV